LTTDVDPIWTLGTGPDRLLPYFGWSLLTVALLLTPVPGSVGALSQLPGNTATESCPNVPPASH